MLVGKRKYIPLKSGWSSDRGPWTSFGKLDTKGKVTEVVYLQENAYHIDENGNYICDIEAGIQQLMAE